MTRRVITSSSVGHVVVKTGAVAPVFCCLSGFALTYGVLFSFLFRLDGEILFFAPGFALRGEVLSLACPNVYVLFFALPKKSTKRKANPEADPLRRFPVLLVKPGTCATRGLAMLDSLKQGASVIRTSLRCSAAPTGSRSKQKTKPQICHPRPVCTHRVPQTIRDQGRSCLSVASSAHPLIGEERRASA